MRRGILATRQELQDLRKRIARRPFEAIHEQLRRRCALILETAPVTEAQWRSLHQQGASGSAVLAARTTQGRILDLLIAHHIESNRAYRDRAVEELKSLISWTSWVDPSHPGLPADLCTAEAAVAAVVALDWLWEDLPDADRLRVMEAVEQKAMAAYLEGVRQQAFWYNTYSNWNAVVNSGCGLAAAALAGKSQQAAGALHAARKGLERFFLALGREGGWDEGIGYWGLAMRYVLLFGEALSRLEDDQSILHQRGMDATGLFAAYFTPCGQAAGFGDNPSVPLYGALYLLVKHFGLKQLAWWLDTYAFHRDVGTSGYSAAGLALLFRPADLAVQRKPKLDPLKVYHEIGWAAIADAWPRPGMYVAAKTGDLGASHSQRDMNSIQLQADGEMLLVDLANASRPRRPAAGARGESSEAQAMAHNTIVVGERDHRIDAQGRIIQSAAGKRYLWVAMDSSGACGENVQFVRHVVMLLDAAERAGHTVLVLDELVNGVPERVDLYWHTLGQVDLDAGALSGEIRGRVASLRFALAASVPAVARTEHRALDRSRVDHAIRLSAGVAGRAYFASAFTKQSRPSQLTLDARDDGVLVTFGRAKVSFKRADGRLCLDGVRDA